MAFSCTLQPLSNAIKLGNELKQGWQQALLSSRASLYLPGNKIESCQWLQMRWAAQHGDVVFKAVFTTAKKNLATLVQRKNKKKDFWLIVLKWEFLFMFSKWGSKTKKEMLYLNFAVILAANVVINYCLRSLHELKWSSIWYLTVVNWIFPLTKGLWKSRTLEPQSDWLQKSDRLFPFHSFYSSPVHAAVNAPFLQNSG